MKKWASVLLDEKADNLHKALYFRKSEMKRLAEKGFDIYAIALYFEIRPSLLARTIKEYDNEKVSTPEEIDGLLFKRDSDLESGRLKTLLLNGFVEKPTYYATLELLWQMVAANWKYNEIADYYERTEGKRPSEYKIKQMIGVAKNNLPTNYDKLPDLIAQGFRIEEIAEYTSISFNHIRDNCSGGKTREYIKKKKRECAKKVYELRVKKELSENEAAEVLKISRGTVRNALVAYFNEHPELRDEATGEGRHRRYRHSNPNRYDRDFSNSLAEKEYEIITLRKLGKGSEAIAKATQVKECLIIRYLRENEEQAGGTLYEWKKDVLEQLRAPEYAGMSNSELANWLGLAINFVGRNR